MILRYTGFQNLNRSKLIYACGVIAALLIWVVSILCVRQTIESQTLADESVNTGSLSDMEVYQSFVPQYGKIKTISIDIGKNAESSEAGKIILSLCGTDLEAIESVDIPIEKMKDYALTEISTDWNVTAGIPYFLKIECTDCQGKGPVVHYRDKNKNNPAENLDMYYGTNLIDNGTLNVCYQYSIPMGKLSVLYSLMGCLLIGLMAAGIVDTIITKKN